MGGLFSKCNENFDANFKIFYAVHENDLYVLEILLA